MAVGPLDGKLAPGLVGRPVEPERRGAEGIGQVEPPQRAVDLDGLFVDGAGAVGAGDEADDGAIGEPQAGAGGVLHFGRRHHRRDLGRGADDLEAGDVAQRIELVDGVHHHHAAAGLGLAGAPVGRARLSPIVEALVDDGADADQPGHADGAIGDQLSRCRDRAGAAQLEEHRELQSARLGQIAQAARLRGIERQRLFGQDVLAGGEGALDRRRQQVMGEADIDGGDIGVGHERVDAGRERGAGPDRKGRGARRVGVAGGDDAQLRHAGRGAGDLAGGPAAADDPEADARRGHRIGSGAPTRCDRVS